MTEVSLATLHGKESVLGPVLAEGLGLRVVVAPVDTDALGTFTREIPRAGTQLEAARRKARLGMAHTGLQRGLASEGSFGADPSGLLPWNVELVLLVDDELGVEVVGRAQGPARSDHARVRTEDELWAFVRRAGPDQGLVLRPDHEEDPRVEKGLRDEASLRAAFARCLDRSSTGVVWIEHDLRAHQSPSRMRRIGEAGADLVARWQRRCPACSAPGWSPVSALPGLPCALCRAPTHRPAGVRWGCVRCPATEDVLGAARFADPGACPHCNP
jgi:hypothetical protein